MSAIDVFAIAAHLHVLLRRKTGRVTDTEWMATNGDYARAIVRFAREKAASEGLEDLQTWADKLEGAIAQIEAPAERKPLLQTAAERLRSAGQPPAARERPAQRPGTGFAHSAQNHGDGFTESLLNSGFPDARYVGGLR